MTLTVEGLNINYIDVGQGSECVLLLHGWGANIEAWKPVYEFLLRDYRVVVLDFPGFGRSQAPPVFSVGDYTRVTRKFIEALGLDSINIIAHSFGGRVSIRLCAEDHSLVKKLVLVDAAGVKPRRKPGYYVKVYGYKFAKKLYNAGLFKKALKARMETAGSADYRVLSENMKRTFIKVVNENLTPILKDIKASTLLMWGEKDQETPLTMARTMEREIADSGLVVLKGAGHFSYLDSLGEFLKIVSVFLKG